jgi:hypothetical protein
MIWPVEWLQRQERGRVSWNAVRGTWISELPVGRFVQGEAPVHNQACGGIMLGTATKGFRYRDKGELMR